MSVRSYYSRFKRRYTSEIVATRYDQRQHRLDPGDPPAAPTGGLTLDASSPGIVENGPGSTTTTPSFTPPAGSVIVVAWSASNGNGNTSPTPSITDNLGAHLTYTRTDFSARPDSPATNGQAAMWWAVVAASAPMTITVTNNDVATGEAMEVWVWTGADTSAPIGAHGKGAQTSGTTIAQGFTATRDGSRGLIAVIDWDLKGDESAGTGCTLTGGGTGGASIGASYSFILRSTADGVRAATTTMNVTLPSASANCRWVYAEILPALAIDSSSPAVAAANLTTVSTASFTPPANSILIVMFAANTTNALAPGVGGITDSLGSHLTYNLIDNSDRGDTAQDGQVTSWWAKVTSSAAMTITVSSTDALGAAGDAVKVWVFTGADLVNPIATHGKGSSASAAAIAQSYTAAATNGWGVIGVCDWDRVAGGAAETAGTGCTLDGSASISTAITYAFAHRTINDDVNGVSNTLNINLPATSTNLRWCYVEVQPATAAGGAVAVPYNPARSIQARDYGEVWWLQNRIIKTDLVATPANPLVTPLDSAWQAGGLYWHLYGDVADATPRTWQSLQRNYLSDPSLLGPAPTDPLTLAAGVGGDLWRHYQTAVTNNDRRLVPAQRLYTDTSLLSSALLENELLGSADDLRRHQGAAYYDRREVPQQRLLVSDPAVLGSALLENELLGSADDLRRRLGAAYSDRRLVPQQRLYVSDPAVLNSALLENELLGSADDLRRHYGAAYTDRREVPQQRLLVSDPALLGTALLENELLGAADDLRRRYTEPATSVDRRQAPQQRAYIGDPSLLGPTPTDPLTIAAGVGGDTWRRYALPDYTDRREVPQQRQLASDPLLLTTAALENELLGGGDDLKRHVMTASTHATRWWMPKQPKREATTPGLLDSALLENELLGAADDLRRRNQPAYSDRREVPAQRVYVSDPLLLTGAELENELLGGADTFKRYLLAATNTDRREVPQQRPYISDPSTYPSIAPIDPITVAWGVGGHYWQLYNQPAELVDRREVPQQRLYVSDPTMLATALLENELLGGAATARRYLLPAANVDRREVPQQRPYISDPSSYPLVAPIDPITVAWGVGGTYWLLYNQPALTVDRREVPQQRRYLSDPGLLGTALLENELLGSADDLRRRYNPADYTDRRNVPQQRLYVSDPSLLGALLEYELLGSADDLRRRYNQPALLVDRREVPQQRPYISDPAVFGALLEDPLLGAADDRRRRYQQAATTIDRRLVPQQRLYISDPAVFGALLEGALLGGADDRRRRHDGAYYDRRETIPPRIPRDPNLLVPPVSPDPTTLAWGAGGNLWQTYSEAATHVERRSWWPPRPVFATVCVCIVFRPTTGATGRPTTGIAVHSLAVTAEPHTGTNSRPNTGITKDPCC